MKRKRKSIAALCAAFLFSSALFVTYSSSASAVSDNRPSDFLENPSKMRIQSCDGAGIELLGKFDQPTNSTYISELRVSYAGHHLGRSNHSVVLYMHDQEYGTRKLIDAHDVYAYPKTNFFKVEDLGIAPTHYALSMTMDRPGQDLRCTTGWFRGHFP